MSSMEALKRFENRFRNKKDDMIGKSWREKAAHEMTERDWRIFREDNDIFIKGGRVASPFKEW